jgi:hypothetical protein
LGHSVTQKKRVLNERSDKDKFGFHDINMSKLTGTHKNLSSPDSIYLKKAGPNLIYIGGVVQKCGLTEPGHNY